jgi:histidinol-phosphate aminotransferase
MISRRAVLRGLGIGALTSFAPRAVAQAAVRESTADTALSPATPLAWPIALDSTRNAYGPSARAMNALQQGLTRASWLPDSDAERLVDRLAAHHQVQRQQVVLGCGSGELLRAAVRGFASGGGLVTALPTYDVAARYAAEEGIPVTAVRLTRAWSHDLDAMLAQCGSRPALVYICNPNNPTGTLTRRADLERFLEALPAAAHVLIDEAYHHYVEPSGDYKSFIDAPIDHPRVMVVRSFSKMYGLAGLRIGYAIAPPPIATRLQTLMLGRNVSVLAARAAAAAIDDPGHVEECRIRNANDRQEFLNQANARMVRAIDSQTNFVMIGNEHPMGAAIVKHPPGAVIEHFAANGIALASPVAPLDDYLRVSLGTPTEMGEFWRVWDLIAGRHTM